ncbi:THUMP domain-containing protein 3-like isoform X2 [Acanthaster planci]|uniref:THUMP domain-containing protein 3-like isoform X2 n=1 Tax=Acanthaster planci TaxID=133434 RepID=A0A8B7Z1H4_ACAPL|nr:THUMP domain-containing protein 3-like isoform X2 [Acanthaster planci]
MHGMHGGDGLVMEGEAKFVVGATVATGFERTALDECTEKLGCDINASVGRGKVYFEIRQSQLKKALHLRTVNHLFVVVKQLKGLNLCQGKDESLQELCSHLSHSDWVHALDAWMHFRGVHFIPALLETSSPTPSQDTSDTLGTVNDRVTSSQIPSSEDSDSGCRPPEDNSPESSRRASEEPLLQSSPYLPTFRVTAHRVGDNHSFSSQEAAGKLGEYLAQRYGWPVRLKSFEMEVLVNVTDNDAMIGINLTEESMHKRNIVHFGPTTLRSTLAHCMLRLGEPQPGDVICDPMCGGGSIPLEAAQNWPCFVMGGDNHDVACLYAGGNVSAVNEKRRSDGRPGVCVDVLRWDVTNLPLRTNSLDLIVSDMDWKPAEQLGAVPT